MKLTDRLNENTQTIEELWESIALFTARRSYDNRLYDGDYPLDVRKVQIRSLKALVHCIEETHKKFDVLKNESK